MLFRDVGTKLNIFGLEHIAVFFRGCMVRVVRWSPGREEWAKRLKMNIVSNAQSGDPSAVLFDGLKSAKKNESDVVIVDTAGRLLRNRLTVND